MRRTMTTAIFHAWRRFAFETTPDTPDCGIWMKLHDHAFAITQRDNRLTARKVTTPIRSADAAFYQELAAGTGHAYTHEGLTSVWKKIKAVLPRNRTKQKQAQYDIAAGLQQHYVADLEAGVQVSRAEARNLCIERNNRDLAHGLVPPLIDLDELPTLAEVEELCLKQRPHRAAGLNSIPPEVCHQAAVVIAPHLHNIMLKAFLSGVEPFQYKGRLLCAI